MVKVNPIAAWTHADVDDYMAEYDVLINPLLDDGYPSIGCAPCTRRVGAGEDAAHRTLGRHGQDRVRHPRVTRERTVNAAIRCSLDVAGRRAVVVGGGPVAARRARGLVEAGAEVSWSLPWVVRGRARPRRRGSARVGGPGLHRR